LSKAEKTYTVIGIKSRPILTFWHGVVPGHCPQRFHLGLALAKRERAPLVSADKRLLAAAKKAKGIGVRTL
jgi:hypothetical protein